MCKAIEEIRREEREEGRIEGTRTAALRMLKSGRYSFEEVSNVSGFSLDEVKMLRNMDIGEE